MDRILASAQLLISSYDAIYTNSLPSPVTSTCKWFKPFSGWIKINTYAACGECSPGAGLGAVGRNWDGKVVFAKAIFNPFLCGVMLGEANAILEGVKLALNETQFIGRDGNRLVHLLTSFTFSSHYFEM